MVVIVMRLTREISSKIFFFITQGLVKEIKLLESENKSHQRKIESLPDTMMGLNKDDGAREPLTERLRKLNEEIFNNKMRIQEIHIEMQDTSSTYEYMIGMIKGMVLAPEAVWESGNYHEKQILLKCLFPTGIIVDSDGDFRKPLKPYIYSLIEQLKHSEDRLVVEAVYLQTLSG